MCAWTGIIDLHAGVNEAFEWVCEEIPFYVDCIETSRQFLDAVIFVFHLVSLINMVKIF